MSALLKRNYNSLLADHALSIVCPRSDSMSKVPGPGKVKRDSATHEYIMQGYPEKY
jgi:hypothetical protein